MKIAINNGKPIILGMQMYKEKKIINISSQKRKRESYSALVPCAHCGKSINMHSTKCEHCGVHFQGQAFQFAKSDYEHRGPKQYKIIVWGFIAIIGFFVLAIIAAAIYS